MIIDHIDNAPQYYGLGAGIEAGLRFLRPADLHDLSLGKKIINGEKLFAIVSEYMTNPEVSVKWEAHRRYIDIQYIVNGAEAIGYQCVSKMEVETQYNETNDALFLRGDGIRLLVPSGFFVVFYPQDAHRPGLNIRRPQAVRKVVVKVMAS